MDLYFQASNIPKKFLSAANNIFDQRVYLLLQETTADSAKTVHFDKDNDKSLDKDDVSYDEPTSKKKRPSSNYIDEEETNAIKNEEVDKQEKVEEKEIIIEVEDANKEDADVEDKAHESFHDSEKTEYVPMTSDTEEQVRSNQYRIDGLRMFPLAEYYSNSLCNLFVLET